jgi:hypothetical protein
MRVITRRAMLAAALMMGAGRAEAGVIIAFDEVGSDVVASASGTINLTGMSLFGSGTLIIPVVEPDVALVTMGLPSTDFTLYQGLTGPSSFGPGGSTFASSGSGTPFGVQGVEGFLVVPFGYASGQSLSSSATFVNTTISGVGLTPGTYSFHLPEDTITVQISPPAVPKPSTLAMAGLGAAIGLGYWYRSRGQVSARC